MSVARVSMSVRTAGAGIAPGAGTRARITTITTIKKTITATIAEAATHAR